MIDTVQQTLAAKNIAALQELYDSAPEVIKPIIRSRQRAREKAAEVIGLIPNVAYSAVTELTMDQKEQLHNARCPIQNHDHRLRVVYTIAKPEDGQLISRLACDQRSTYRWELEHGVACTKINSPHWGFSKIDDQPYPGMIRYETKDYL